MPVSYTGRALRLFSVCFTSCTATLYCQSQQTTVQVHAFSLCSFWLELKIVALLLECLLFELVLCEVVKC